MNKLVGKFPVFGSNSKLGSQADAKGDVVPNVFPAYYLNNKVAYGKGFENEPNKEQLNGVLGFITSALSELYTRGVPSFALNVAYPKGAVVTFNGNMYVSLSDDNTTHISQTTHWGKVNYGKQAEKKTDDMPIGTILTVPVTVEREGYIDYVEGKEFAKTLYPDLYKVLGSNRFVFSNSNNVSDSLPVGSCIHVLSNFTDVPEGYVEWNTQYGSLRRYPELKRELMTMAQRITEPQTKQAWLDALTNDSLPMFEDFYLGSYPVAGLFMEDTVRQETSVIPPVVLDYSNTLNPLGVSRCVVEHQTYPLVASGSVSRMNGNSPYLVTGIRADQVAVDVDKREYAVVTGNGSVTRPRTLSTRVLIKAVSAQPSAISSTHKRIIKAFD